MFGIKYYRYLIFGEVNINLSHPFTGWLQKLCTLDGQQITTYFLPSLKPGCQFLTTIYDVQLVPSWQETSNSLKSSCIVVPSGPWELHNILLKEMLIYHIFSISDKCWIFTRYTYWLCLFEQYTKLNHAI